MTPYALVYALHVLAALVWVGGMFFAWTILRPAAVAALLELPLPTVLSKYRRALIKLKKHLTEEDAQ